MNIFDRPRFALAAIFSEKEKMIEPEKNKPKAVKKAKRMSKRLMLKALKAKLQSSDKPGKVTTGELVDVSEDDNANKEDNAEESDISNSDFSEDEEISFIKGGQHYNIAVADSVAGITDLMGPDDSSKDESQGEFIRVIRSEEEINH